MELKDFVRQSLLELSEAVHEANEDFKKARNSKENVFFLNPGENKDLGRGVHFDLAVTTKAKTGTGGKAKVNISVLELKTGGESQQENESISRIRFTVAIAHYVG